MVHLHTFVCSAKTWRHTLETSLIQNIVHGLLGMNILKWRRYCMEWTWVEAIQLYFHREYEHQGHCLTTHVALNTYWTKITTCARYISYLRYWKPVNTLAGHYHHSTRYNINFFNINTLNQDHHHKARRHREGGMRCCTKSKWLRPKVSSTLKWCLALLYDPPSKHLCNWDHLIFTSK